MDFFSQNITDLINDDFYTCVRLSVFCVRLCLLLSPGLRPKWGMFAFIPQICHGLEFDWLIGSILSDLILITQGLVWKIYTGYF